MLIHQLYAQNEFIIEYVFGIYILIRDVNLYSLEVVQYILPFPQVSGTNVDVHSEYSMLVLLFVSPR